MARLCKFNKIEKQYFKAMETLKQEQLDIKKSYMTFYKKIHGSDVDMKSMEEELEAYTVR